MSRAVIIAVGSSSVLLAASCAQTHPPRPAVQPQAGHWVHSTRLQSIMMDLRTATDEDWPGATESTDASVSDDAREAALDEACVLAAALQVSARKLPHVAREADVPQDELQRFMTEVQNLEQEAQQLEQASLHGDVQEMHEVLNQVLVTCDSCHVKFRDLAGPINAG